MTEFMDSAADIRLFRQRASFVRVAVLVAFSLLIARLVYLQIVRHEDLAQQAESNRTAVVPIVPNRGLILDRNGVVLATNDSVYTLEITPSKVGDLEDTIDRLSSLIQITSRDRRRFQKVLEESRNFDSVPIRTRLSDIELANFAAQSFEFPGVAINARLTRNYPFGELASHVIGYVGRINQREKEHIEESDESSNYRGTDRIGKLGVEQSFERELHGTTGVEQLETSASGQAVRRLGTLVATSGKTVQLSLDIKLQQLVEELFGNRRGALVALDPTNGEILAFVSKPTFDPNLFVDGIDQDSWSVLSESIDKPLLNRALRGTYPPGSTYKPFMALAALETGTRNATAVVNDPGFYNFAGHRFGSPEGNLGGVDLQRAIMLSSNVYFYTLANDMGVDAIHNFMAPLGFGQITGVDLPGEVTGVLPSTEWKRRSYKRPEQRKWYSGETISLGIGQGYNSFTMLQLAQATAILANGGIRHRPHVARSVRDLATGVSTPVPQPPPVDLGFKPANLAVVRGGMVKVVTMGTARKVFEGARYTSAGKTGTAQATTQAANTKYDPTQMDERRRDHSVYMSFAPVDHPCIAVAAIVENAGWSWSAAAPLVRKVFDYWLAGQHVAESSP